MKTEAQSGYIEARITQFWCAKSNLQLAWDLVLWHWIRQWAYTAYRAALSTSNATSDIDHCTVCWSLTKYTLPEYKTETSARWNDQHILFHTIPGHRMTLRNHRFWRISRRSIKYWKDRISRSFSEQPWHL